MKVFITKDRTEDGAVRIFQHCPRRYVLVGRWYTDLRDDAIEIDDKYEKQDIERSFDLKWENEPIEAELILTISNNHSATKVWC